MGTYPEEYDVSDKKIMKKDGKPTPPPSPIWKGHKTRKPPNIRSRDRNKKEECLKEQAIQHSSETPTWEHEMYIIVWPLPTCHQEILLCTPWTYKVGSEWPNIMQSKYKFTGKIGTYIEGLFLNIPNVHRSVMEHFFIHKYRWKYPKLVIHKKTICQYHTVRIPLPINT